MKGILRGNREARRIEPAKYREEQAPTGTTCTCNEAQCTRRIPPGGERRGRGVAARFAAAGRAPRGGTVAGSSVRNAAAGDWCARRPLWCATRGAAAQVRPRRARVAARTRASIHVVDPGRWIAGAPMGCRALLAPRVRGAGRVPHATEARAYDLPDGAEHFDPAVDPVRLRGPRRPEAPADRPKASSRSRATGRRSIDSAAALLRHGVKAGRSRDSFYSVLSVSRWC